MRIAYLSPLNPDRSGISDYSEELLPYLSKYLDIDVFTKDKNISNLEIKENFSIFGYHEFKKQFRENKYDLLVYHMGNNYKLHIEIYELLLEYPGIVVLHDYAIHHFMAGYTLESGDTKKYVEEMIYNYGLKGFELANKFLGQKLPPIWETDSMEYPLNKRIIDRSHAIITTSKYIENKIKLISPVLPITFIPLHAPKIYSSKEIDILNSKYRKKYKLRDGQLLLGAFGFATPNKRIECILEVLSEIKKIHSDFTFIIAGEVAPNFNINFLISKYNLKENVKITGYLNLDEFKEYMIMCDVCFNLRYPIQGESSASLIRMMGFGKPVFVTDIGPFSEIPDETVLKIPYEEENKILEQKLKKLMLDVPLRLSIGNKAREYIEQNSTLELVTRMYVDTINDIYKGNISNINLALNKLNEQLAENLISINWDTHEKSFVISLTNNMKDIGWL